MKITNEDLIKGVRALAKELDRTPKKREFKHYVAAIWRFGTWNNFIKAANLMPLKEFELTTKDYEKVIHNFVKEHGHIPTKKDFDNDIYLPDTRTIERRFRKTWNEILISLGYKPSIRMNDFSDITDDELLSIVNSELERIGSTTMVDYMNNRGPQAPSIKFLKNRFGIKWNEILKYLGFEVNVERRSKKEWLQLLKDVAVDLGRTPSANDMARYGLNDTVYKLNFGSWNNAIQAAGLKPNLEQTKVIKTNEELLEIYVQLCKKLGRAATYKEIDKHLPYKADVFAIRFGGINNLRELAGYERVNYTKKYSKKEIKGKLIDIYRKYGRRLNNNELKNLSKETDNFPALTTILRYFQTTRISEVWKEVEDELNNKNR